MLKINTIYTLPTHKLHHIVDGDKEPLGITYKVVKIVELIVEEFEFSKGEDKTTDNYCKAWYKVEVDGVIVTVTSDDLYDLLKRMKLIPLHEFECEEDYEFDPTFDSLFVGQDRHKLI